MRIPQYFSLIDDRAPSAARRIRVRWVRPEVVRTASIDDDDDDDDVDADGGVGPSSSDTTSITPSP
jgi:hypothetical protein